MRIEADIKFDFSDVLIRPKRSTLQSRADVSLERTFCFLHSKKSWTGFPLVASNMDTIGTFKMATAFVPFKSLVALHKFYAPDQVASFLDDASLKATTFVASGVTDSDLERLAKIDSLSSLGSICLDVANGYQEKFLDDVKATRERFPSATIMAGSVATGEMTEALLLAGADIVRVGIGSGSVCTTRLVAGVGYPQLSAVIECADAAHGLRGYICSDGGCTTPGDISKALGAGADFVMIGGMLAGHDEWDGTVEFEETADGKKPRSMSFYGMSSETAMIRHAGGVAEYRAAEGKTVSVPYRGAVKDTLQRIQGGVRSAMTYVGAFTLKELPKRTTFVRVNRQANFIFGES